MRFALGMITGFLISILYKIRNTRTHSQDRLDRYYRRRAKNYQATDQLFQFFGYKPRVDLRRRLVDHAQLKAGDSVLDIGCGSGANFPFIMERIGETGKLVAVDYSQEMLDQAQKMVDEHEWKNVTLVQADAGALELNETFDVVLSALAMVVIPQWESAMQRAYDHVRPGGVFAVADICNSQRWYVQPINFMTAFTDWLWIIDTERRPWERMESWLEDYRREDWLLGFMYAASGHKPTSLNGNS